MLTFTIDENNLITYHQDGISMPENLAWAEKEGAITYAQAMCDEYNNSETNPNNIKYPEIIN